MKVAISSPDGKANTPFSPRFGRCESFIIFDSETGGWEAVSNPGAAASGGAGATVVQFLANRQVGATITGKYGPTAFKALQAAGIQGFEAAAGTPAELYQQYLAGELKQVHAATGRGRHG